MAINKMQDGKVLRLTVGSGIVSGNPVVVGNGLAGVALTSYDSVDGKATIAVDGVFDLAVQAANDTENNAVAVGDRLYYAGSATPWLSKKKAGKFFGIALEAVTSGSTATIEVLLVPLGAPDASHLVVAAGTYTVPASPAPGTTTTITIAAGVLATDVVLVQQAVDQAASPSNQILKAIAQASPDAIIVTTSGAPTAGDKFNYAVLRSTTQ